MTTYLIKCHVCGDVFEHKAGFLGGAPFEILPDGRTAVVVTCNLRGPVHPPEEVRASYKRLNGGSSMPVGSVEFLG